MVSLAGTASVKTGEANVQPRRIVLYLHQRPLSSKVMGTTYDGIKTLGTVLAVDGLVGTRRLEFCCDGQYGCERYTQSKSVYLVNPRACSPWS